MRSSSDAGLAERMEKPGSLLQKTVPSTGFTLETYLRPEGNNAGRTLLAVGNTSLLAFDSNGQLGFHLGQQTITDATEHEAGQYYHASAVYDGNSMMLYIDCLLVD